MKRIRHSTLFISILLFALSLTQKCFDTEKTLAENFQGVSLLLSGLLGILGGESAAWLCWLANPVLFIAWKKSNSKSSISLFASLISLFITLMFLNVDQIMIDESGGNFTNIIGYKTGYWLWVLSAASMFIGNTILYFYKRQTNKV